MANIVIVFAIRQRAAYDLQRWSLTNIPKRREPLKQRTLQVRT